MDKLYNEFEVVLWITISVILVWRSRGLARPQRLIAQVAAIAFFQFGPSDVVEIQTGAWWTPWWLFVWKALCVGMLVLCWWKYRALGRRPAPPRADAKAD